MLRIGTFRLDSNLCLSPLAGYTNLPFRLMIRPLGGLGLATTDLINARSLLERNGKALKLIETCSADQPLAVQLFGSVAEEMRDAALWLEAQGIPVIDINMGCPVRKVCRTGGGSAMLAGVRKTAELARQMVRAVKIPVTAKMRLGWDDQNIIAPDLARALEDAGVAAVFVHGRTRAQGFGGMVNLEGIHAVVKAVRGIPVIGNGDVVSPETAGMMLEQTGCQGISIGRGALYDPWIFKATRHYLDIGATLPEPTFEERISFMSRHLELMVETFGESAACLMFRKVGPWYARQLGPAHEFKSRIVQLTSRGDFDQIVQDYRRWREQFLDSEGQLKPRFRPTPLTSSLVKGAAPRDTELSVPKGPVGLW